MNGELLLQEEQEGEWKTLTKMPFQKILILFVVGNISITTPLIDKCKQNGVALIVVKPNFRPVFYWSDPSEGNYLLRQKQYSYEDSNIELAKYLVLNKIQNQIKLLENTRKKDEHTLKAIDSCHYTCEIIQAATDYDALLGLEGAASKLFFGAYYQDCNWKGRMPRVKPDAINATLDIGYTILFNYIESMVRLFGFDVYVGVYHKLWFKRKSLICDLMEPFRCIIDNAVRNAFKRKQFKSSDFTVIQKQYRLQYGKNSEYTKVFFDAIIKYKQEIFSFVRDYYRSFMKGSYDNFPVFSY